MSKPEEKPAPTGVHLTNEQFAALLARHSPGVDADFADMLLKGLAATKQPGPWDDKITPARQAEMRLPVPSKAHRLLDLIGSETRPATKARAWCERGPNGETIFLSILAGSYVYPRELLKYQDSGGLCPNGLKIVADPSGEMMMMRSDCDVQSLINGRVLTKEYLLWVLQITSQHDLGNRGWCRVGGLRSSDVDPEGQYSWSTPWDDAPAPSPAPSPAQSDKAAE